MIAQSVSLQVIPGQRDAFLAAIEEQSRRSVSDEPGCRYFDVTCDVADDHHFVLYELYDDEAALAAHRTTAHFKVWREAVGRTVVPGSQVNTVTRRLFHNA